MLRDSFPGGSLAFFSCRQAILTLCFPHNMQIQRIEDSCSPAERDLRQVAEPHSRYGDSALRGKRSLLRFSKALRLCPWVDFAHRKDNNDTDWDLGQVAMICAAAHCIRFYKKVSDCLTTTLAMTGKAGGEEKPWGISCSAGNWTRKQN